MSTASLVNSAGLVIDIIGALMIFLNSPKLEATAFIGATADDPVVNRRNKIAKYGMGVIMIGFAFQLVSNFL
ncbi:MAG: hypothetical protein AB7K37_15380 [Cyclobacteriaceae bacterium]